VAEDLTKPNPQRRYLIGIRLTLILISLALWFWTQSLLGARGDRFDTSIGQGLLRGDGVLLLTEPVNRYLHENTQAANALLIVSSLLINVLAFYLFAAAIFGRSIRPFLGLLILFALRQLCQGISALPAPPDMIWHQPTLGGWEPPGLLVTYGVGSDFFFSGHTAIAVYGAIELARLGRVSYVVLGILSALFQIGAVIVLRAHWTVDVYAGIATAMLVAFLVPYVAPWLDRRLDLLAARCARRSP